MIRGTEQKDCGIHWPSVLFRGGSETANHWSNSRMEGTIKRLTKVLGSLATAATRTYFHSSAMQDVRFDDLEKVKS